MPAASAYITREEVFFEVWLPRDLGPRAGKLQALGYAFKPLEYGGRPQHAIVTGPSGSGKTVMSQFLCDQIDDSDATNAITASLEANTVPRRWGFHRALYEAVAGRAPNVQRASTATADLRRLVEDGEMQWLPTPVVAEAYYGVATARSDTTEQEVRNRILGYPRIDIDEEIARTAGELLAAANDQVGETPASGRTTDTSPRWPAPSTTRS